MITDLTTSDHQSIDVLKKDGPEAAVSQRSLAARLSLSKTRINQLLAGLSARGVVKVEPSAKGTRLKVV